MFGKFFGCLAWALGAKSSIGSGGSVESQDSNTSPGSNQSTPVQCTCDMSSVEGVQRAGKMEVITVSAGDLIPCDGVVKEGFALVDESAVAGVSTPAMIEATAGRNQVLAGTLVVEGSLTIQPNSQ